MIRYNRDGTPTRFSSRRARRAEVHCADAQAVERGELVTKAILRTGEWPVMPTKAGVVNRPLIVKRDGVSDAEKGIISLAELIENFNSNAVPSVQIPLSDGDDDHKNSTAVNTGFVRELWIEDDGDTAKLVAALDFTEPEVREKVLRGTYADVSSGIPWDFQSRGKRYNAALEHVAITNRPFVDGLGPFLAASDSASGEVVHFSAKPSEVALTDAQRRRAERVAADESFEVRLSDARRAISGEPDPDPALEARVRSARESIGRSSPQSPDLERRIEDAKAALGIGGRRV